MNWEEYRKEIDSPIDGQHNFGTQIATMAWLSYQTHANTIALEKQIMSLTDEIDRMKAVINELRSDVSNHERYKKFMQLGGY